MNHSVRILVVDDDPDILNGTARLLEKADYTVDRASSGEETLQAVQVHPPDLLLLDCDLPGIDGIEVCRRIKLDPAMAYSLVLLVSATRAESDEQAEGLESGADGYIGRPIANRELLARVESYVRIFLLTRSLRLQAEEMKKFNAFATQARLASLNMMEDAVAERDRAEQASNLLRASEDKYRNLFESSHDAIMTIAPPFWRFTSGNPATVKMFGAKTEADFICYRPGDLSPERQPDGRASAERSKEMIETAVREGSHSFEWTHKRISGEEFSTTILLSRVKQDEKVFLQATVRDITEHKRAEQELKESKALVDTVVENVPLMIFIKEATDLRFVIFNRAGEELLGYDRKALLGKNNLDLFPPEQAAHFMAKDREVLDDDAGVLDIPEEAIQTAKKGQRLLHTRKVCIRGGDGKTKYLLGISEDITDRKLAEQALRESEERHRTILHAAINGFWLVDLQGHLLEVNEAYCQMSGYSMQELLAMHISDLESAETAADTASRMQKIMAQGKDRFESRHRRKNGSLFDIAVSVQYQPIEGGRMVAFLQDITERKKAEAEILKQLDELRRWQTATSGREGRILAVKKEVNELLERLGEKPRYPSAEAT